MINILILVLTVGFIFNANLNLSENLPNASFSDSLALEIAQSYGVDFFSNVKRIEYTFNVESKNGKTKRSWAWEPGSEKVSYEGKDKSRKKITITYSRSNLDTNNSQIKYVDQRFINDQYWLLFPFHLVWDDNIEFEYKGTKELPIGKGKGKLLVVKYKNNVGYTPNDIFELYLDENNIIKEWAYRPGGSDTRYPATWEDNKKFEDIIISTTHYGPDKNFKLWFSDIKVDFKK